MTTASESSTPTQASDKVLETLLRLVKSFPTDTDMIAAGWEPLEIEEACAAYDAARAFLASPSAQDAVDALRGLDTPERVRFYEHDFYVLSNFSAFTLMWRGIRFDTSEAAYHWEKFPGDTGDEVLTRHFIQTAASAHEAFKIAGYNKQHRRSDWDEVKVEIMLDILRAKASQHEYVRRKLLATGDRELVEDSWRDDYWGWGPNRDGQNMLGKLWMQVRAELRASSAPAGGEG